MTFKTSLILHSLSLLRARAGLDLRGPCCSCSANLLSQMITFFTARTYPKTHIAHCGENRQSCISLRNTVQLLLVLCEIQYVT